MARFVTFGRSPGAGPEDDEVPDWRGASAARIERALARAVARPTGGWAVLDASDRIGRTPRAFRVAGRDLVAWRGPDGRARVGPGACPHMGALLCEGRVDARGHLVCRWHGLALGDARHGAWAPLPLHEDGVLAWVRLRQLLGDGPATDTPILPPRPARHLCGVIRTEARCEPSDVVANRLDPWHGVHLHPHSFLRLRVLDEAEEHITVRVVYRVLGPLGMEVDARFSCPDARTIVMTIVGGEGVGSVVETHATPIEEGRTAIVEATLATSDRALFGAFARASRLVRPLIERRAARLWVEDAAYAERRFALRAGGAVDPPPE